MKILNHKKTKLSPNHKRKRYRQITTKLRKQPMGSRLAFFHYQVETKSLYSKAKQGAGQPFIEVNNINMLIKNDYQCGYDNSHR